MFRSLRKRFGAVIAKFTFHPILRYRVLLPLLRHLTPDADESILARAFMFAAHTNPDGDYLEFGVWKGRSFAKAYHIWDTEHRRKNRMTQMRLFAFDSFEGLPELTASEDRSTGEFKKGDYTFSQTAFKRVLKEKHVAMDRVRIIPGWFNITLTPETASVHKVRCAAVIWVDCDLYASTVPVLEFISDLIGTGTVIIFDDWFCFGGRPDHGEQKAFEEWLSRHPDIKAVPWHSPSWKSQAFILYRI